MFETDFYDPRQADLESAGPGFTSRVAPADIAAVYLIRWEEHCVECFAPICFKSCPLYARRRDRMCARFRNGIVPNRHFRGLLDYGADLRFKRWGKLEAKLIYRLLPLSDYQRLVRLDAAVLRVIRPLARLWNPLFPFRKINLHIMHHYFRTRFLASYAKAHAVRDGVPDELLIEAHNPEAGAVRLQLEIVQDNTTRFREGLLFPPGHTLHRLPYARLNIDLAKPPMREDRIFLYPENDAESRIIFTWLNFVQYVRLPAPPASSAPAIETRPVAKVKCLVWDLDNTVWDGILIEDGPDRLRLRPGVRETLTELDRRGILQSIASKNDHTAAWDVLGRLGLQHFFVAPQITWGPKSDAIRQIAAALNLNPDSFALIDDSAFERGEVQHHLPQVRTYSEAQMTGLPGLPEMEVPVTEESRKRREMYQQEARRKVVAETFHGHHEDFLRSCDLKAEVFVPRTETQILRCYELIQRANQLNISGRRHSREEFEQLARAKDGLTLAVACEDKFGIYGLVGCLTLRWRPRGPVIEDFVLSCRVAGKRVEHAVFKALAGFLAARKRDTLYVDFVSTPRNGMMRDVLKEIGFAGTGAAEDGTLLKIRTAQVIPWSNIVAVQGPVVEDGVDPVPSR